jgi:hypothetical protein
MLNEIFLKRGATPYLFESSCALIIGAKLLAHLLHRVYTKHERSKHVPDRLLAFQVKFTGVAGGAA